MASEGPKPFSARRNTTSLPREILVEIAGLLEKNDGGNAWLRSFMQVCREWQLVGREAIKNLLIRCDQHLERREAEVSQMMSLFPNVGSLHLKLENGEYAEGFQKIVRSVDRIRPVHIKHLDFSLLHFGSEVVRPTSVRLPKAISQWEWLESLAVRGALVLERLETEEEAGRWIHLSSLTLAHSISFPPASSKWTSLQCLKITCFNEDKLPEVSKDWSNLRVLDLTWSPFRDQGRNRWKQFPSFVDSWNQLEVLKLQGALSLESFPTAIGAWENLREVSLTSCSFLRELPLEVGMWQKLETLSLKDVGLVEFPDSAGNWTSLRTLKVESCLRLKGLPDAVHQWGLLERVSIGGCNKVDGLPSGVEGWRKVRVVKIRSCGLIATLPEEVREWRELQIVELNPDLVYPRLALPEEVGEWGRVESVGLGKVGNLPASTQGWSSLTKLSIGNLEAQELPAQAIAAWKKLMCLSLRGSQLRELPEAIGAWERLQTVRLSFSNLRMLPESVGKWREVTDVTLSGCEKLRTLPESVGLWHSLCFLSLGRSYTKPPCTALISLPDSVRAWKSICGIDLTGCTSLQRLPDGIGEWSDIRCVGLETCNALTEFPKSITNWSLSSLK